MELFFNTWDVIYIQSLTGRVAYFYIPHSKTDDLFSDGFTAGRKKTKCDYSFIPKLLLGREQSKEIYLDFNFDDKLSTQRKLMSYSFVRRNKALIDKRTVFQNLPMSPVFLFDFYLSNLYKTFSEFFKPFLYIKYLVK